MTQEEILEGNKLIAEFMEFPINTKQVQFDNRIYYNVSKLNLPTEIEIACEDQFDFNRSYDWLMPVVEKIELLGFFTRILDLGMGIEGDLIIERFGKTKLEGTYITVVEFVKWYNLCQKEK